MKKTVVTKKIKKDKVKKKKNKDEDDISQIEISKNTSTIKIDTIKNTSAIKVDTNKIENKENSIIDNEEEVESNYNENELFEIIENTDSLLNKISEIENNLYSSKEPDINKEITYNSDEENEDKVNIYHKKICIALKNIVTPSLKSKIFDKMKLTYGEKDAIKIMKFFNNKEKDNKLGSKNVKKPRGRPPIKSKNMVFDSMYYNKTEEQQEEVNEADDYENIDLNGLNDN